MYNILIYSSMILKYVYEQYIYVNKPKYINIITHKHTHT